MRCKSAFRLLFLTEAPNVLFCHLPDFATCHTISLDKMREIRYFHAIPGKGYWEVAQV